MHVIVGGNGGAGEVRLQIRTTSWYIYLSGVWRGISDSQQHEWKNDGIERRQGRKSPTPSRGSTFFLRNTIFLSHIPFV